MTATVTAPQRPTTSRRRTVGPGLALLIGPLVVLGVGLGYPLAWVIAKSFTDRNDRFAGLSTWSTTLSDPAVHKAVWRTVEIAGLATAGCLVTGTFIAFVLAFVPFPGAGAIVRIIEAVVSLPSFLLPLALGVLFGPVGVISSITGDNLTLMSSVTGVVLAEIAFYTPFVVRPVLAAFSQFPGVHIDVASSLGAGPLRIATRVILPRVRPSLAAAGSLTFLLTLNEFGIVLFTGAKDVMTLPMMIYTKSIVGSDFATAAVIAVLQLALSVTVYLGYRLILRRFDARTGV
ncbi:2-aminoethylphosphonate ABC transporter permease subunit [Gordonia shandongensis]|uniref:2-aminoethylphosphonate ABC transporter permease subunit n=1 Tax=Gordonia shandongensis TaxID=376351 RepID=UPI00041345B2|nr:2-aminoethylphosphonate ABC transporter permease subunit [Gordonia shandongensis]